MKETLMPSRTIAQGTVGENQFQYHSLKN